MNILAIDSTGENLVVALSVKGGIFEKITYDGAKKHNSNILVVLEDLLEKAGIGIKDVDYYAAVAGPGSFTGIRIGVSTINALAFASDKKCVAINSLEELAYPYNYDTFYTAVDCGHDSFYYAKFARRYDNMIELGEMTGSELDSENCVVIKKTSPSNPKSLIAIAADKINRGEFSTLAPLYLKKSQAEREYERKNMDKMGIK